MDRQAEAGDPKVVADDGRGRDAEAPHEIPTPGLRDVFWRVVSDVSEDRVPLIAGGVTYYLLLALFPALTALVSLYGIVADPTTISGHIGFLVSILPPGSFDIINDQLSALTQQKNATLGFGFFGGLLVALWSANNGVKALFEAMNIAYGEEEKRSFIRLNLMSLLFTFGALLAAVAIIFCIGLLPVILAYVWLDRWLETVVFLARWPVILLLVTGGILLVYRFGPSRERARMKWLSWGAVFSTLLWLVASIGFSFYLNNFAHYNVTYGALGTLIGFMVWTWISMIILIVGAEINAELEHQTARDTTTGPPKPMGERGAYVADTVGEEVP